MNILLTGGRAPATLELARAFHRAGHTVFMAESLRGHLSQPSAAVKANFVVPAPRLNKEAFILALQRIIVENHIDLLIPTCEEIFYVSMGRDELPCTVFAEPIKKLNVFHNKWSFVVNAIGMDLYAPETILISNQDDVLHAYAHWRTLVLKPVYSRFAARTLIKPPLQKALSTLKFETPWVAQEFLVGQQYCTYSVCHNGVVHAHTAYPTNFTAGPGAAIVFNHVEHPAIFNWVKTFVRENNFTGQIAFDFIQTSSGQLYALECNPRTTSGVHLLASNPMFVDAFVNPQPGCITPLDRSSHMLSTAMVMYALPEAIKNGNLINWLKTFFTSNDVIFDLRDPMPFLFQLRSVFQYLTLAQRYGITALEASTFDIEWNGKI